MKTLNDLSSEIKGLRIERSLINQKLKEIEDRLRLLEADLVDSMLAQGIDRFTADGLSMSLNKTPRPLVEDWDALYQYIYEHNAGHLLQRRVTATTMTEMREGGEDIPGVRWDEVPSIRYKTV